MQWAIQTKLVSNIQKIQAWGVRIFSDVKFILWFCGICTFVSEGMIKMKYISTAILGVSIVIILRAALASSRGSIPGMGKHLTSILGVSIVTILRVALASSRGSIPGMGKHLTLLYNTHTGSGGQPNQIFSYNSPSPSPELKIPRTDTNCSPQSTAKFKNKWRYTSTPCIFMVW